MIIPNFILSTRRFSFLFVRQFLKWVRRLIVGITQTLYQQLIPYIETRLRGTTMPKDKHIDAKLSNKYPWRLWLLLYGFFWNLKSVHKFKRRCSSEGHCFFPEWKRRKVTSVPNENRASDVRLCLWDVKLFSMFCRKNLTKTKSRPWMKNTYCLRYLML